MRIALILGEWLPNFITDYCDNTVADTKDKVRSFFHRVHMDKSGNILAIGEQYLKVVSGLGIASRALGGGGSTMQINILNMVAVELGKDLSLKSFSTFAKKKTTAHLPPGYGAVNSTILAAYVKLTGGFDYEFATFDKTRDLFATVYRDYDRKGDDGKKADVMFGVIKFEDGKLSSNKTPLNITSSRFWLQPAKPGYITVVEYFKKKKTLSFRMEKIVY